MCFHVTDIHEVAKVVPLPPVFQFAQLIDSCFCDTLSGLNADVRCIGTPARYIDTLAHVAHVATTLRYDQT